MSQSFLWALLALMTAPLALAVWMSFAPGQLLRLPGEVWSLRWYRQLADSPLWIQAIVTSLRIACEATALALAAALGGALALGARDLPGRGTLAALFLLPALMPNVVLGIALLPFVRETGLWGTDLSLAGAHAVWVLPIAIVMLRAGLDGRDPDLEAASRGLGLGPVSTFRRVTLPLLAPHLGAAGLSCFVLSLNEFVIALFLGTPGLDTLPRVIWPNLRYTLTPLVAAASTVSLVLTLAGLVPIVLVIRRSLGGRSPAV